MPCVRAGPPRIWAAVGDRSTTALQAWCGPCACRMLALRAASFGMASPSHGEGRSGGDPDEDCPAIDRPVDEHAVRMPRAQGARDKRAEMCTYVLTIAMTT